MKAQLPANESKRLETLRQYAILDTLPEVPFDDLTRIAAQICATPIALISLVDEERQWFKSRIGLDATETHRDLAFCAHAILKQDELLEVRDALKDPRFVDNPLVASDPHIRFYAGTPLVVKEGHALGTLCVIDREPRELSEAQRQTLRALGRHVALLIESRQLLAARQRAEAAVLRMNDELRVAVEEAREADRLKSAFLATMSHELRTPLNSILGFTGIILQGLAGPLNPEQSKQLGLVQRSARHLLALINDVLDISKIEAGELKVARAKFDLRASIANVVDIVTPLAEKRGLALRVDVAPEIGMNLGDARRVEQVLLNLVNNAIKFTEHGEVALTAMHLDGRVQMNIVDTGIGIEPADLKALFQPFRQVDTGLARNYEGIGLGLMICKRLAELMGGEIQVKSEKGKGSTFTFTLPLNVPEPK